jgi:hypothetical protein
MLQCLTVCNAGHVPHVTPDVSKVAFEQVLHYQTTQKGQGTEQSFEGHELMAGAVR